MNQPTIELDIFDYVTVNGRISKKLCEKVFVAKINELESKLKAQKELIDKLERQKGELLTCVNYYADPNNWGTVSIGDILEFTPNDEEMTKYIDGERCNTVVGGMFARQTLAKMEAR